MALQFPFPTEQTPRQWTDKWYIYPTDQSPTINKLNISNGANASECPNIDEFNSVTNSLPRDTDTENSFACSAIKGSFSFINIKLNV